VNQQKPILVKEVNLIWYPVTLVPIVALVYFSFNGTLPQTFGLIAIFLFVFWVSSFIFAVVGKLTKKKKPELRQ
jgi:hypothetical protein